MARRVAVCLVALVSCHIAGALRQAVTPRGGSADCPAEVAPAGKDQCVDLETDEFISMDCCRAFRDCRRDFTGLQSAYVMPLNALMQGCGLPPEDLASLVKGDTEHFNKSKACEPGCQAAVAALPPLPDFEAFRQRCHQSLVLKDLQMLEGVEAQRAAVMAFLDAAEACVAKRPPPTPRREERTFKAWSPCDRPRKAKCPHGSKEVARRQCIRIPFKVGAVAVVRPGFNFRPSRSPLSFGLRSPLLLPGLNLELGIRIGLRVQCEMVIP